MSSLSTNLLFVVFIVVECYADRQTFKFKGMFMDKLATIGAIQRYTAVSRVECSLSCSNHQSCASMFYTENTKSCSLHNQSFTESAENLVASPGTKYYEVKDRIVPTLAPPLPELTEEAPCPQNDTIFRTAVTSNGTFFQFRIFMDAFRNFSEAETLCQSHDSSLYKVLTPDKMSFTLSLLSCPAYSDYDFWTNGYKPTGGDGIYMTTDGEPIPMTPTFWYPRKPDKPNTDLCISLEKHYGHMFDDDQCSRESTYTICEM